MVLTLEKTVESCRREREREQMVVWMVEIEKGSPVRGNNQYSETVLLLLVLTVNWRFGVPHVHCHWRQQGSPAIDEDCAPIRRILFFKVNNITKCRPAGEVWRTLVERHWRTQGKTHTLRTDWRPLRPAHTHTERSVGLAERSQWMQIKEIRKGWRRWRFSPPEVQAYEWRARVALVTTKF